MSNKRINNFDDSMTSKWDQVQENYRGAFGYAPKFGEQRYQKNRRYAKKSQSKWSTAGKTLALVRREIRKSKVEKKYTITNNTAQSVNAAMTGAGEAYFLLNNIAKGTDDYQRDGDSIALRQIRIAGSMSVNTPFVTQSSAYYLTIFVMYCKSNPQGTSANLPWTSLLNINGAYQQWTGLATDRYLSVNTDDFGVLYRKDVKLTAVAGFSAGAITAGAADTSNMFNTFDIRVPFKDKHITYEAGSNNPSTFNPFVCFAITNCRADQNTASTDTAYVNFIVETRFVDDN